MLTGAMESLCVAWRSSLQTHVLCGRLAGLARHGADMESRSAALCTEVRIAPVTGTLRNSSLLCLALPLNP